MCKSMTGYGRGVFTLGTDGSRAEYSIETRSLNHKHLDVTARTPDRFFKLEHRIRDEIKKRFSRGGFTVHVQPVFSEGAAFEPNMAVAKAYVEAARKIKAGLGLDGEVTLDSVLKVRDIFARGEEDAEADWIGLSGGLKAAMDELNSMREREGTALRRDIEEKLASLEAFLASVEAAAPEAAARYRERLIENIKALAEKADEARVLTEAAIFAEKASIAEEITRLKSHIKQVREYLAAAEPVGRRLDFLCQELLREINTIASKSQDVGITRVTVEMKGELEKIREQVQNIE